VEAGATWLLVGTRLRMTGRRPLTMPDNPRMTVGGALAIAEIGDTGSVHGSVISQVQRLTVVTPDGEVHRVKQCDPLFRLALGGAGLTGAIAEATLRTMVRTPTLWSRTVAWRDLNQFIIDAQANSDLRLYEIFLGMLRWVEDAPVVYQLAGNFAEAPRAGEAGLWELNSNGVTGSHGRDRFQALAAPIPWNRPKPGLVLYLPMTAAAEALRLLAEFIRREPALKNHIETLALMVMKTDARFPLAPWPAGTHAAVVVVRPSLADREAASTAVPLLRTAAIRTLELGGKIGHGSIDLGLPAFTELQLGGALESCGRSAPRSIPKACATGGFFRAWTAIEVAGGVAPLVKYMKVKAIWTHKNRRRTRKVFVSSAVLREMRPGRSEILSQPQRRLPNFNFPRRRETWALQREHWVVSRAPLCPQSVRHSAP
jgi:hypothetical protein